MHAQKRKFSTFLDVPRIILLARPEAFFVYWAARRIYPYTQLKFPGLFQMYELIREVNAKKIPGSIVEMGCGQGGNGAFMVYYAERSSVKRDVWLLDSFEGLPEPAQEDIMGANKYHREVKKGFLKVEREAVDETLCQLPLRSPERVHVVEGWFDDTVPQVKEKIGAISILRLDADLYEPTKYALERLYEQVAEGGLVVVDDYDNWIGCRRALYDFFSTREIAPRLQFPWYGGGRAYFQKSGQ